MAYVYEWLQRDDLHHVYRPDYVNTQAFDVIQFGDDAFHWHHHYYSLLHFLSNESGAAAFWPDTFSVLKVKVQDIIMESESVFIKF